MIDLEATKHLSLDELRQHMRRERERVIERLVCLITNSIRLDVDENNIFQGVSTFRIKNTKARGIHQHWRRVWRPKVPYPVEKIQYFDNPYSDEQIAGSNIDDEVWRALDNRRYFDNCRCCGYLYHVDLMVDGVCSDCVDKDINVEKWHENDLVDRFIRVTQFDGVVDSIAVAEVSWDSPYEPIALWNMQPDVGRLELEPGSEQVTAEIKRLLRSRRYFQTCTSCGQLKIRGHMEGRTCHSCMESSGVVF